MNLMNLTNVTKSRAFLPLLAIAIQMAFAGTGLYAYHRARVLRDDTLVWVNGASKRVDDLKAKVDAARATCDAVNKRFQPLVPPSVQPIKPCAQGGTLGPGETCSLTIPIEPDEPMPPTPPGHPAGRRRL